MKKVVYIFILLFSIFLNVWGQDLYNGTKTIPELTTPNADTYNLGRYGEIPMNLYTGTANIIVPLHTLNFEGLPLPINLTYNTSALRVDQEAAWTGLGWTLSCEPVITRQIKGNSDLEQSGVNTAGPFRGYIYTDVVLPGYGGTVPTDLNNALELYSYRHAGVLGWDTEPDIFTANIFGESISFIFKQKAFNNNEIGIIILNSSKRYKVAYNEKDKNFTLTNEDGFQFFFTEKEYSIVAGKDANGFHGSISSPEQVTGWKLSKILSPNNKTLTFSYDLLTTQSIPKKSNSKFVTNTATLGGNLPADVYGSEFNKSEYLLGYTLCSLKKITCDQFSVSFVASERLDVADLGIDTYEVTNLSTLIGFSNIRVGKLDHIIISDNKDGNIKDFNFTYSYFNGDKIGKESKAELKRLLRLKLDQISLDKVLYRKFTYIKPNELPNKSLRHDDFWGYYNGPSGHSHLLYPSMQSTVGISGRSVTLTVDGDNRFPNFEYAKAGLLEKIVYPTGGYTVLQHEAHDVKVDEKSIAEFMPFGYEPVKEIIVKSESVDYPKESEIVEILENTQTNTTIEVRFGINSDYNLKNRYDHIKYDVEERDCMNVAYQLINIDTNNVIDEGYFSMDGRIDRGPLSPTSSPNWNRFTRSINLPRGRYKIKARGLKHISNFFNEQDNAPFGHKDYGKQYNYMVSVSMKVPLFSFTKNANIEIGGSRVKSITNYDISGYVLSKKEYKYISSDQKASSGTLINKLIFSDYKTISYSQGSSGDQLVPGSAAALTVYSDNLAESESSHIGYSRVEEITIDKENQANNGYTVSEFINSPNTYGELGISGNTLYYPVSNAITKRENMALIPVRSDVDVNGRLKKETSYNKQGQRVKESIFRYNRESVDSHNISHSNAVATGIKQYVVKSFTSFPGSTYSDGVRLYIMQIYKIISENILLISQTDTQYLNGNPISKVTTYTYNDHYQPKEIRETGSRGLEKETTLKYAFDFGNNSPYKEMIAQNIISPVIEKKERLNNSEFVTRTNYTLTNNMYLPASVQSSSGGALRTDLIYNRYDSYGNIQQYTALDGLSVIYLWSYLGQYPIAEIKNSTYSEVETVVKSLFGVSSINGLSALKLPNETNLRNGSLQKALPNALVTTYTYKPLVGMTSMTDPRGVTTTYEYDAFGRLSKAKDVNGKVIQSYDYHYQGQ